MPRCGTVSNCTVLYVLYHRLQLYREKRASAISPLSIAVYSFTIPCLALEPKRKVPTKLRGLLNSSSISLAASNTQLRDPFLSNSGWGCHAARSIHRHHVGIHLHLQHSHQSQVRHHQCASPSAKLSSPPVHPNCHPSAGLPRSSSPSTPDPFPAPQFRPPPKEKPATQYHLTTCRVPAAPEPASCMTLPPSDSSHTFLSSPTEAATASLPFLRPPRAQALRRVCPTWRGWLRACARGCVIGGSAGG